MNTIMYAQNPPAPKQKMTVVTTEKPIPEDSGNVALIIARVMKESVDITRLKEATNGRLDLLLDWRYRRR